MKKILILLAISIFISNFSFAQKHKESALEKYSRVKFKIEAKDGITRGVNENYSLINAAEILKEIKSNPNSIKRMWTIPVNYTLTGGATIYDFQSNGTVCNVIQDPGNTNRIHVVCTVSPLGDPYPDFPNRTAKYYYSTNKGVSFSFINNLGGTRSGFPHITLAPNGNALISANYGSGSSEKTHWYYDAAPGLGSFTELYPTGLPPYLYARTVFTNSLVNPVKFVTVVSSNDLDSVFRLSCQSLAPSPGTFTSPQFINAKPFELYCIARGDSGRIGIAYIVNNLLQPADFGDVFFIESINSGVSFGNPVKIFTANFYSTSDSLAAFRGISMAYKGIIPKVVFETVKQTTNGYYFPAAPSKIRFWSTSLPGSDPYRSIVLADTSSTGYHPYISKGTNNDAFAPLCRPTIGVSLGGSGNNLFAMFMVPSNRVGGGADTVSYMSIRLTYSLNNGTNWMTPQRIYDDDTNHLRDWTYPSLSPTNDASGNNYNFYFTALSDSLPGTYINHPANGQSVAKQYVGRGFIAIIMVPPNPSALPKEYKLYQNYPNPFNPATIIRYETPLTPPFAKGGTGGFVTLKVYDILGKEVATLVNEKQSPGIYEVSFDARHGGSPSLSSGIYFYKLETENFTDIKRMILIK